MSKGLTPNSLNTNTNYHELGDRTPHTSYTPTVTATPMVEPAAPEATNKVNSLAVVSLVLSIVLPLIGSIPAIICGHFARKKIRATGEKGDGQATAGIIIGYVEIIVAVIVIISFSILWANGGHVKISFL